MIQLKKTNTIKAIIKYVLIPLLVGFIIVLISFPSALKSISIVTYVIVYSCCLGIPSLLLFTLIERKLEKYYPWLKSPLKRLILSVIIEVIIVLVVLALVSLLFVIVKKQSLDVWYSKIADGYLWAISLTLVGIVVTNGVFFFKNWRQSAINEEILKREKLLIEYEALRNQVNPHFLFNSLTALTTLVYDDADKAAAFIRKFSDVYRYVLENRNQEIISLRDEIRFIENIAYLYEYRHGNNLKIKMEVSPSDTKFVLPMALQMILENALKHNSISEDKPLKVIINEDADYITVWNNLQLKRNVTNSNKVGLNNIKLRYSYLSDQKVIIDKKTPIHDA